MIKANENKQDCGMGDTPITRPIITFFIAILSCLYGVFITNANKIQYACKVMEAMEGEITIKSIPGKNSPFTFKIPLGQKISLLI